jgi:hypothetical protein
LNEQECDQAKPTVPSVDATAITDAEISDKKYIRLFVPFWQEDQKIHYKSNVSIARSRV